MTKFTLVLASILLILKLNVSAQNTTPHNTKWIFQTRMIMTGSSDHSEPKGYMVYSAISFEPSITRVLSKLLSMELNVRTESHEVDILNNSDNGDDIPLGSIELLPINLIMNFSIKNNSVIRPYAGAGVNATFCWEKSGALNSTDLPPSIGPAVQIGTNVIFSSSILGNINLGWNSLRTEIQDGSETIATLQIDPISLGFGLGFRF